MKKIIFATVGIFILVIALSFFKDIIVKVSVENGVELVTGLKLSIRSFHVGIIRSIVSIKGLKLYNPKGFRDKVMIDIPEIYLHYDLPAIISGRLHLHQVHIYLKEFVVVKNENGELNLDFLKVVKAEKVGALPEERGRPAPKIQIDELRLKIVKAIYKDYSMRGLEPVVKEFYIDIDEKYSNINNPYALVSIIVVRVLANTAIANLTNFDLNGLTGTVSDTLSSAEKMATRAQQVVKGAEETVKQTTKALEDIFKSPFGSGK